MFVAAFHKIVEKKTRATRLRNPPLTATLTYKQVYSTAAIVRMLKKHLSNPAHTIGKPQVDNFVAICQETISGRTGKEWC
jgi:precorrin-6x reductase